MQGPGLSPVESGGHGRAKPKAVGRIVEGNPDAPQSGDRIGLGRNLPDGPLHLNSGKKL